jgi:hypothetical protein
LTAIVPLPVWQPGTLQPSTPFNDLALRVEVLQRGATSILSAPPGSPADGQVHILGASPTGAWSTFAQNDVVVWRSGTWYRFAPFLGWLKQVGSEVRRYDGSGWVVISGGAGAVPVQEEGTTVVTTPTAINFVGAGVTATNAGGVATVTIPGGGGGGIPELGETSSIYQTVSASGGLIGIGVAFATGSANADAYANTNILTRANRTRFAGSNATNSVGGVRSQQLASVTQRWAMRWVFGVQNSVMNAAHRAFSGLNDGSEPTDANPSGILNCLGFGYDSADTQWQFMTNDNSGSATKTALGGSFPKPTAAGDRLWLAEINCDGAAVNWKLTDLETSAQASGSVSADLPQNSVRLAPNSWVSAGGVSTIAGFVFVAFSLRTFYR